ncbi:MAG: hypothetical protein KDB27_31595 [Planctomycetales bacterium]|nr:hypothetical protein [Planctomycetales bacterium]
MNDDAVVDSTHLDALFMMSCDRDFQRRNMQPIMLLETPHGQKVTGIATRLRLDRDLTLAVQGGSEA